jgi:hypothetical protein
MAARPRQHDAHVRARRAILRRVINRALEWTSSWASSPQREQVAAAKLAQFCRAPWPSYWMTKTAGRYPNQVEVPARDIPSMVIHSIMCKQVSVRVKTHQVIETDEQGAHVVFQGTNEQCLVEVYRRKDADDGTRKVGWWVEPIAVGVA